MDDHATKITCQVIVVGAGAAGLLAAGSAALQGCQVMLLEKKEQPGRKLLITGKGRCNITNDASLDDYFRHIFPKPRFLKHAFSTFFSGEIIDLLNRLGVSCKLERGGRYFPASDQASDVVAALTSWVEELGVHLLTHSRVRKLLIENQRMSGVVVDQSGSTHTLYAPAVIIATGGLSYPATGSDGDGHRLAREAGHTIVKTRPALVPLETTHPDAAKMQGLALKNVKASVWSQHKKLADEFGELLFTHFGLSGPIILGLSRKVVDIMDQGQSCEVVIDMKPALDEGQLDKRLLRDIAEHGRKKLHNLCRLWLPAAMVPLILERAGISGEIFGNDLSAHERKKLRNLLKNYSFPISGYRSFKEAIITAGGVATEDIQSKTMESKLVKGLYFAGETIDLDANTGGYNLQIAWSTGWLAGASAAETVNGDREQ